MKLAKAFILGFGLVGLVSANSIQTNRSYYVGAFIVGCLISAVWVSGVNHIVNADKSTKIAYCVGAGAGTVTGMFLTSWFYRQ